ncbi:MAG TPA: hypothetical protein DDY22_07980 [Geobacter sp.]|nr:hypothetical protein [Geobacter sp.]
MIFIIAMFIFIIEGVIFIIAMLIFIHVGLSFNLAILQGDLHPVAPHAAPTLIGIQVLFKG